MSIRMFGYLWLFGRVVERQICNAASAGNLCELLMPPQEHAAAHITPARYPHTLVKVLDQNVLLSILDVLITFACNCVIVRVVFAFCGLPSAINV
ncbi:hypothetical protein BDR06DRAFT_959359 [Suillus hirtellus]|nr:hypothetical protein BDR06DRAFT_959359 [Suillus hirtellus]